ncbi:NUDIX hydrolase [Streptosporangium sp. NBC_01755]|uniref:NUDIX hydrolase n=1 Tax=unclassified Streptosporangium TaxID=2632669 RepID=UPI002DDC460C|nr:MULTISPECIES: NUDIX hydrolase [unclassified Streptosporangium]WSA27258.1 NUDIX hydrolase [Streptosporangium sp. NBC_01810]WSD01189.1 NUDIX hydrolase [Streptosporangium sp. NBC_01755]
MSNTYIEPAAWYATLPSVFISACLLLTDGEDRVLLVKPNYRPGWGFPGGVVEDGEAPHHAAMREVAEELGVSAEVGDLLVVHWSPPSGERPRPLITFMFDGGVLNDLGQIRLQVEELDEAAFLPWDTAATLLPESAATRLRTARLALRDRRPIYLSDTE